MSDEISVELSRVQVLELICVLENVGFTDDAKPRFERITASLQKQLIDKSTIDEIFEATEKLEENLDEHHFPEIIGE